MVFNARWGILATGGIAKTFTKDLLRDPAARGTNDVTHTVTAVGSSSSKASAERFISDIKIPGRVNAYGSYEELVKDPTVDIIYVATPHSHHFQNTMLALEAGKHVLCEKAFTVNAAQAKILCETAQKKNLFLMEAVWTRYFPISVQIREHIQKGTIGEVLRVVADNSIGADPENDWDSSHRMVNMDLAGGALLDLGIYALTWVFQTLYHTLPREQRRAPSAIVSNMVKYDGTGADEDTTMVITFPTTTPSNLPNRSSHAVAMTAFRVATDPDQKNTARPAVRIQGTKGEIQVDGPPYRPTRYRIIPMKRTSGDAGVTEVENPFPSDGHGMYWEADEAARCLRDGKLESDGLPWEESIIIMETMDEIRKQNGLVYPEKIESTAYPVKL